MTSFRSHHVSVTALSCTKVSLASVISASLASVRMTYESGMLRSPFPHVDDNIRLDVIVRPAAAGVLVGGGGVLVRGRGALVDGGGVLIRGRGITGIHRRGRRIHRAQPIRG